MSSINTTYVPKLAKGEILVVFNSKNTFDYISEENHTNEMIAKWFGEKLGYKLSEETYAHGDAYIFKVPEGKEDEAIKKFQNYTLFVDWADYRDLNFEKRIEQLESIILNAQKHIDLEVNNSNYVKAKNLAVELKDNVFLSEESYTVRLEEIISYVENKRFI